MCSRSTRPREPSRSSQATASGCPRRGDAGSITFTTLSADRLVGTFEVTVEPQADSAATRPLVVTEGSFDIGREEP